MIRQKYIETLILISPNWKVEFHVYTYASFLVIGIMLFHNLTRKNDQPMVYVSRLRNRVKHNYST